MKTVLKILKTLALLFIIGILLYHFRGTIGNRTLPLWEDIKTGILTKYFPCKEPIPYNLGTFDPRFNVSKKYFLEALAEAESIWEKPTGKELFNYASEDFDGNTLVVNLIYDYREQATKELADLGITVKNTKASYDALRLKLDELKLAYGKDKNALNKEIAIFNQEQDDYNKQVKYWNSRGGAPEDEYNKLEDQKEALEKKARSLEKMEDSLNAMANEINALVTSVNSIAKALNLTVKDYNTVSTSRGETFEEAIYKSEGFRRQIDVYEFPNREKLVRVLAHELGHALGIEHVDDPKAIMYASNAGEGLFTTKADLDALKMICGDN